SATTAAIAAAGASAVATRTPGARSPDRSTARTSNVATPVATTARIAIDSTGSVSRTPRSTGSALGAPAALHRRPQVLELDGVDVVDDVGEVRRRGFGVAVEQPGQHVPHRDLRVVLTGHGRPVPVGEA